VADEQLYGALSDSAKAQEIWKHRKSEFPKNKKLRKMANKIVKNLDVADKEIIGTIALDKKADKVYDKDKKRIKV
jgi:hypothetical protein